MMQGLHWQIRRDREHLLARRGTTVSAIQLLEKLPRHPVITMPLVPRLPEVNKRLEAPGDRSHQTRFTELP